MHKRAMKATYVRINMNMRMKHVKQQQVRNKTSENIPKTVTARKDT